MRSDEEKNAAASQYRAPVSQSVANYTGILYEFVEMFPLSFLWGGAGMSRILATKNENCLSANTGECLL
jgi:hypothetical protein